MVIITQPNQNLENQNFNLEKAKAASREVNTHPAVPIIVTTTEFIKNVENGTPPTPEKPLL